MTWWQSIIYGLVQGLTEFLPISSSGHLALFNALFEWMGAVTIDEAWATQQLFFFAMLHVATVLAICAGLWRPIVGLFKKGNRKTILWLVSATVPAGIVGLCCNDAVEAMMGNWHWLWICFLITAVLLFATELLVKRRNKRLGAVAVSDGTPRLRWWKALIMGGAETEGELSKSIAAYTAPKVNWWQALVMGYAQAVAVFPGISRSGSTVCGGLAAKVEPRSAADFSFLMSIPIILASALLAGYKAYRAGALGGVNFGYVLLGMFTAFVFGFLAVKFMLRLIKRVNYKWFSLYLLILSLVLCILQFTA